MTPEQARVAVQVALATGLAIGILVGYGWGRAVRRTQERSPTVNVTGVSPLTAEEAAIIVQRRLVRRIVNDMRPRA